MVVGAESIRKYLELKRELSGVFDENTAHRMASVVVFNGDEGVYNVNGKMYEVTLDGVRPVSVDVNRYYEPDGNGFYIIEDGEIVGFTMPQEEVRIADFSVSNYELSIRFRYEVVGKPVLRFADGRPNLVGKLVFYKKHGKWHLGRIENVTPFERGGFIIVGVPIINGEPLITQFIPVTAFGYPNDENIVLTLLKSDIRRLKDEYLTKENLESLAKTEALTIAVVDRLLCYKDELLLWEIGEDILSRNELRKEKVYKL